MKKFNWFIVILFAWLSILPAPACRKAAGTGSIGITVPVGREKASAEAPCLVVAVKETGPAFRAGIRTDDRIVLVNGVTVDGRTFDYIYGSLLSGEPGTAVEMVVERNGAQRTVTLKRSR